MCTSAIAKCSVQKLVSVMTYWMRISRTTASGTTVRDDSSSGRSSAHNLASDNCTVCIQRLQSLVQKGISAYQRQGNRAASLYTVNPVKPNPAKPKTPLYRTFFRAHFQPYEKPDNPKIYS